MIVVAAIVALQSWGRAQAGASFRFGVAGDFTDGSNFRKTAGAVRTRNPDFMLALGDLSYNSREKEWCEYWKLTATYRNLLVLAGNHDSGESPGGDINKYITHCPNPLPVTIVGTYGKEYYFDYPPATPLARFIMVVPGLTGSHLQMQANYDQGGSGFTFVSSAIDDARSKGIAWIFVGMHKNYISTLEKANEISTDSGRTFMTMMLNKKVDVIFQGHEHGYERSKQLTTNQTTCTVLPTNTFNSACVVDSDNALVKGAGTVIHVLGTGGKSLRDFWQSDPENPYFAAFDVDTYGFGHFTVNKETLSFLFERAAGGVTFRDAFTITSVPR